MVFLKLLITQLDLFCFLFVYLLMQRPTCSTSFLQTKMKVSFSRPVYTTADFGYGTDKNGTGAKKKSSVRINF